VLNIGGFSDAVFETVGKFVRGTKAEAVDWVSEIKKIDVRTPSQTVEGTDDETNTPVEG
jgi:hypothetical protein